MEGYEDIDAFDCIDLDIDNCSVTVRSSYDDEFHISYKFIASKEKYMLRIVETTRC